jgi:type IV fimbrial biogenesis protein FimT
MRQQGFTLYELISTLSISLLILSLAIPSFNSLIKKSRLQTTASELLQAIEQARTMSALSGKRTVLLAENANWSRGWALFMDENNNGVLDGNETYSNTHKVLKDVIIKGNDHIKKLVSFVPSGEARGPGTANGGVIMVGKLAICPARNGEGHLLVLSKGGRTRADTLTEKNCEKAKQGDFNF